MVLCPTHHDQATKGALPTEEQRALKANPFNKIEGFAKGPLAVKQSYAAIEIGSNLIINEGPFLIANDEELLSARISDQQLFLSLCLRSKSNELLCRIIDNEWLSGDPLAWDIEADWQKLIVREKRGSVNLRLDLKSIPARLEGELWSQGYLYKITKDKFVTVGPQGAGTTIRNLGVAGSQLKIQPGGGLIIDPAGDGMIVSWPDKRERLWKTKSAWEQIRARRQGT